MKVIVIVRSRNDYSASETEEKFSSIIFPRLAELIRRRP